MISKQVNIEKEQKVSGRIEGEQKIIEGLLKARVSEEKNKIKLDIIWTTIIDKKNRINVNSLSSSIDLENKFLKRGTSVLVKGSLPNNITIKTEEKEKKDTARNSTNINTGGISSPVNDDNSLRNNLNKPNVVSTYEGCVQIYNQNLESIGIYKQEYYFDNNGKQIQVKPCSKVKEVPANYKTCSDYDDYTAKETYKRKQAYFVESEKEYSAGGCMTEKTYKYDFTYESCDVIVDNEYYFKTGRIYYVDNKFEKVYLTECILNPYDEEIKEKLNVDFENCPVDHNGLESVYFGRYYYMDKENKKHVVSDCMRNYLSQIPHKIEFIKWENFDNERYALKWQKVYILYPKGSQQYELQPNKPIYITGNEADKIRYEYTPINIKSRVINTVKTISCANGSISGNGCDKWDGQEQPPVPQPNPLAVRKVDKEKPIYIPPGEHGTGGSTTYKTWWEWIDYTKQCNIVYKRPDNTTLNLNNWWTLIESWDVNPVNNAVCK